MKSLKSQVSVGVVVIVAAASFVYSIRTLPRTVQFIKNGFHLPSRTPAPFTVSEDEVPRTPPDNSVVVLNFSGSGDKDAALYAVGFARALSSRISCAPTTITLQPSWTRLSNAIEKGSGSVSGTVSKTAAIGIGKRMGAKYIVCGSLSVRAGNVEVRTEVTDVTSGATVGSEPIAGNLKQLPQFQSSVAEQVVSAMKVKLTKAQAARLKQPNFGQPEALAVYAKSLGIKDKQQAAGCLKQALKLDPKSLFVAISMADAFDAGQSEGMVLVDRADVLDLMRSLKSNFSDDTGAMVAYGVMLIASYRYREAEGILKALAKHDPCSPDVQSLLEYLGECRGDYELAADAAETRARLWETSPGSHVLLSRAYYTIAKDTESRANPSDKSAGRSASWTDYMTSALREAIIASKIDPQYADAWIAVFEIASNMGRREGLLVDNAFSQIVKLSPKCLYAYKSYAYYAPEGKSLEDHQASIIARAEKAFGRESADVYYLKAYVAAQECDKKPKNEIAPKVRGLFEKARAACKSPRDDIDSAYYGYLSWEKDKKGMFDISKQGMDRWKSPTWKWRFASQCKTRYQDTGDKTALSSAARLFGEYVSEVPQSADTYAECGWCLSHLGKATEAKKMLAQALKIDPQNETAKSYLQEIN